MYLFGGSSGVVENKDLFSLDLNSHKWKIEKQLPMDGDENHLPKTRDEHTAVLHGASMVIFGGFSRGIRGSCVSRSVMRNDINQNKLLLVPFEKRDEKHKNDLT